MSSPNQVAAAASTKDSKNPVGGCPFKHKQIALVPVRYALDEPFEAPGEQPHPLPAKDFIGPLTLQANRYTLRQLRDGWLYVFDEAASVLDEYEVKGQQFVSDQKGNKGHLLYPAHHTVAMAFSHQRWTARLKTAYCEQRELRTKGMRSFNLWSLAINMGGTHAGLLTLLSGYVADMGLSHNGFAASCAPVDATPGAVPGLLWHDKPEGSPDACKAGMPDEDSALVVALDDVVSDIHDLTVRQCEVWAKLENPFSDDVARHKWAMATITEMVGLPPVDEQRLPAGIKNDRLATFRFKKRLLVYANAESERLAQLQAPPSPYNNPHKIVVLTEQANHALADLQGYEPAPDLVRKWSDYRYQDAVRWEELEAYIAQHQPLQDKLRQQGASNCDDALTGLAALPANPLLLGIDTQTEAGQTYLIASHQEWLSIIWIMVTDQTQMIALQKMLQGETLPSLAHYGFDPAVKEELVAQSGWLNIGNSTAVANAAAGWSALANDGRLLDSKLFSGLSIAATATMNALHKAVTGPAMETWEQLTMVLRPLLLKGHSSAAWVAAAALESVHTGQAVRFNKSFGSEVEEWLKHQRSAADIQSRQLGRPGTAVTPHQIQALEQVSEQLYSVRWPRLLILEGKQTQFDTNVARYQSLLRQGGARAAVQAGKVWDSWGNFGGLAVLINMANLVSTLDHYQENRLKATGDPKALADLDRTVAYTAAWTGNAIASVYQGSTYGLLKQNKLLGKTLLEATGEGYGTLARRYTLSIRAMAGLGLVAAVLEVIETRHKLSDPTNADKEQYAYWLKIFGLLAQSGAAIGALYNGLGSSTLIGFIWAPWMVAFTAIGCIAYLLATWMLARFSRTPIERWLVRSTWGTKPAGWSAALELWEYERLAHAPEVIMDDKGQELVILIPPHINKFILHAAAQRMGYQSNTSHDYPVAVPVYGTTQRLALSTTAGQQGQYHLPHTLHPGDKVILLIVYPVEESLGGKEQRFVVRGDLALSSILTAETDCTLPVAGVLIEMKS